MKQFIKHVDEEYLTRQRGGQWKPLKNFLH
jgi:hypothetical protein